MNVNQQKIILLTLSVVFTFLAPYRAEASTFNKPPYVLSLSQGLVGYWTFDGKDVPNGAVTDMSGNGNTGHLTNISTSTFYTLGKIGQGFNFDGVNDYVDITETSGVPIYSKTNPYSVAFWTKTSSTSAQTFYSETNTSVYTNFILGTDSYGELFIFIRNDSVTDTSPTPISDPFLTDGKWHHIVWTDQAGAGKVYIDGVQDSNNWTYTPTGNYSMQVSYLGTNSNPGTQFDSLSGSLDDVRVYNRVLSATEVKQLYNMGR